MDCTLNGTTYEVLVTNAELITFAQSFPCHGLDLDSEYVFQFDSKNGDLVDLSVLRDGVRPESVSEEEDGEGLRCLSEDAGLAGAEQLGLQDVIAIRFSGALVA
jgi:hypothetical protein